MKAARTAAAVTAAGALLAGCAGGPGGGGGKISDGKVVLAVLNDQSGVYSQLSGRGSVKAVEMAVADYKARYGAKAVAKKIEVISADHQNKPDIAHSKAQELIDRRQADAIFDVPTSSAALAVAGIAKARKRPFFDISAATTALEGAQCNRYTFHYGFNSSVLANSTGATVTKAGGRNWYIVYPDYAFGQDMNASFGAAVKAAGGTVVKSDPAPFPSDNFSSFLLKAPGLSPKPQVLGTMQAGGDLVNFVKQYNEYKLRDKGISLAVGLMFLTDIHALGPDALAGTQFTDPWYWNADATNRGWANRYQAAAGKRPTFPNAASYSAALQYLEAVQRAGTDRSDAVVKQLEGAKVDDPFGHGGTIRAADHVLVHDVTLAQVKPANQVGEPWDYEKVVATVPGDQAFPPVSADCKLGLTPPYLEDNVAQAFNGLVGGAFYALLALGLSVIFGMLGVVNFAHGAFYMLGAFGSFILLDSFGANYWISLVVVPIALGVGGVVVERLFVRRLAALDPLYNFLFTFGLALILQDAVKRGYGVQSQPYPRPSALSGSVNLGLFDYPAYQVFVLAVSVLVCAAVWVVLTRTRVGMIVRAATERPELTRALGIDVSRWVAPVFGFGVALAGLAGVLAAPMRAVNPLMGADLIITVFAVVVIGGLGSVFGSVAAGFAIGLVSALGDVYVPALSQTLVFILMAVVLLWRPAGLFGREEGGL